MSLRTVQALQTKSHSLQPVMIPFPQDGQSAAGRATTEPGAAAACGDRGEVQSG